jgi:histidine ammonia-lyase
MMAQVTAAALVSENKVFAHPASVDSITTSGNKEDYVSMGMTAAIKLRKIVDNTRNVLAIEAIAAAQGLEFLAPLKTSKRLLSAYDAIRAVSPSIQHDRVMYPDFARIADVISAGKLGDALR